MMWDWLPCGILIDTPYVTCCMSKRTYVCVYHLAPLLQAMETSCALHCGPLRIVGVLDEKAHDHDFA